ncbi:MAG: LysM peptidoglycan-binding domain-containing protein [Akkermansia sp.]|nr:LysM peptidoglycan-binding domain-containing protein [Akkermansia sp.]
MKKNTPTFRHSGLDRATPKTHRFHSFINNNLKRHRSDVGLVEDRTSSTTVVRIIVGLLLVHLLVIGGVLVRGHLVKANGGVAIAPTVTPPPAAPAAAAVERPGEVISKPAAHGTVDMSVKPVVTPEAQVAVSKPAPADTHITQVPAAAEETAEEVAPAAPVAPTPAPAAKTVTVKHLVNSGETWGTVAAQYEVSVEALKAANPKSATKPMLYQGTYLNVPVSADSERGKAVAATQQQEATIAAGKMHTVKKGESLGLIAKKYKISLKKLMELNNMTDKDARSLKIGTELKVAE